MTALCPLIGRTAFLPFPRPCPTPWNRPDGPKLTSQSYLTYLKSYMKTVKQHLEKTNPERIPAFEKGAQAFAKTIVANFKDYEFYVGESMNTEGIVALLVSRSP